MVHYAMMRLTQEETLRSGSCGSQRPRTRLEQIKTRQLVSKQSDWFSLAKAFPPIPAKLVKRIQSLEFIDLTELLPDNMGLMQRADSEPTQGQWQLRRVLNLGTWMQYRSPPSPGTRSLRVHTAHCKRGTAQGRGKLACIRRAISQNGSY